MKMLKEFLKNKAGISLVELIVTIAIMGLISAGISVAVVSSSRNYSKGSSEVELQQDVQTVTNILSNIVVDSKIARNSAAADGASEAGTLYVYCSDGSAYQIMLDGNELYYAQTVYDLTNDLFTHLDKTGMIKLADNVDKFEPDTTTYGSDYSVKFVLKMQSAANAREMETTFAVTSRNAASLGSLVNIVNGATLIADVQAVIEPHDTKEINYDVFTSGMVTDRDILDPKCYSDIACTTELPSGVVTVTKQVVGSTKQISIHADGSISDMSISKFYIKLETSANNGGIPYDTKTVEVMVRKVNTVGLLGANTVVGYEAGNTDVEAKYQTGSKYEISTVLDQYNGERFLAYMTDMDYPNFYNSDENPFTIRYKVSAAGYPLDKITVKVNGSTKDVTSTFDLDSRDNYKVEITLGQSMPKGSTISLTAVAIHGGYSPTTDDALNKAHKKYRYVSDIWTLSPPAASITRGQIGGSPIEGSDSSKYQGNSGWERFIDIFYKPAMIAKYGSDAAMLANLNDESKISAIKDAYPNVNIGRFYSIGSTELPTEPAENNNNYFRYDGSYYWSQYKMLSTALNNPNWNLQSEMSMRMEPNKFYQLEFVDVIYTTAAIDTPTGTIPANVIVWPKYDKLLDLGFGSGHTGGLGLTGFWNEADAVTGSYDDYGEMYPIYAADIQFLANPTYGVANGDKTIGTESDPVVIGGSTAIFAYNQTDWKGLTYQSFQNDIGCTLQKFDGSGWVDIAGLNLAASTTPELYTSYTCDEGGFKIHLTNTAYEIDRLVNKPTSYNKDTIFRLHLNIASERRYTKDSDGVLSRNVYPKYPDARNVNNREIFNYAENSGFIYFKIQYPDADVMTLDYNDGSGLVRNVEITNNGNSKPLEDYPTQAEKDAHAGFSFAGWYADAEFTTKIPKQGEPANSYKTYWNTTVYARWIGLGDAVTITLDPNGGSCSMASFEVYQDGNIPNIPDATHSNSDYMFDGWYTEKSGGQRVYSGNAYDNLQGSTTLYAHWKEEGGTTISFDANGGSNLSFSSKKVPNDWTAIGELPTTNRSGYTFIGWFTSGGMKISSNSTLQGLNGETVYYARWHDDSIPPFEISITSMTDIGYALCYTVSITNNSGDSVASVRIPYAGTVNNVWGSTSIGGHMNLSGNYVVVNSTIADGQTVTATIYVQGGGTL